MARRRAGSGTGRGTASEGARRASEGAASGKAQGGQRWSRGRKREVVLRILRGESLDELSRELGVEIYRLEQWRDRALLGMDEGLRERSASVPIVVAHDAAMKRVGELTMEVELLRARPEMSRPLRFKRSK